MFFTKKKSKEELAELPLDKDGKKGGKSLVKGVRKFLRYNDDLISDERKGLIDEKRQSFVEALENPELKRKEVEALAEDLTETCKKSVKDYQASAWKENIEVIFVAVVIAMGIRAYFIQQFKIPTGSMQPTLNGIVAYPTEDMNAKSQYHAPKDYSLPALPKRMWDKFWYGRSHVEWVAKEDDHLVLDSKHFYGKTHFIFFPRTYLVTKNGHKFSAPGTDSRIQMLLNQQLIGSSFSRIIPIKKGDIVAKGFVDTGDQLVVNKFVYHWKKPDRGEVFVFNTRDIRGIQAGLDPRQGSQHYIKRIAGIPGDQINIVPPNLMVNGKKAEEPGFLRVMSQEGYYTGYTSDGSRQSVKLGDEEYWALGDNSANSSDSRMWGAVPEHRIVGRGAFVYYPFGHHFGKIR